MSAGKVDVLEVDGLAKALFDLNHPADRPKPFGPFASWDETTDTVRTRYREQAVALRAALTKPEAAPASATSPGKVDVLAVMDRVDSLAWERRWSIADIDLIRKARAAMAFAASSLTTIRDEARHHGNADIAELADAALSRIGGAQ